MIRKAAIPLALVAALVAVAQQPPAPQTNSITPDQVISHLKQTIDWYQRLTAIDQTGADSGNLLERGSSRDLAKRVLDSSFAFARAQAAALSSTQITDPNAGGMQQTLTKATARVARLQQRLQNLDTSIDRAPAAQRQTLVDERVAIAADLALAKEMESAVQTMSNFSAPKKGRNNSTLLDEINSLQSLNPTSASAASPAKSQPPASGDWSAFRAENAGILALASRTMSDFATLRQLQSVAAQTDSLASGIDTMGAPLRQSIHSIAVQSDAISNGAGDSFQSAQWLDTGKQISELAVSFKQLSSVVIPLGETAMALQSVRGVLADWQKQVQAQYSSNLRYLLIRLGVLAGGVILILLASAVWQRAIVRYVADPRRQRQLFLVKRVIVGLALALLLTLGFFSSLSSIATLLGFITAGLALALQNVILSAVAYFFLIGRYGLRVGDRITVQGVTGEVVEVGFIRIFLMELVGAGSEIHPTGRLAVFANSVIFQPSALIKQAPGLDYTWHVVSATVEQAGAYQQARGRFTDAVCAIYDGYRSTIESQLKVFEQTTHVPPTSPQPNSRAEFTDKGLVVSVRYPVTLAEKPGQIDEQMISALLTEAARQPELKFAPGGTPKTTQLI